MLEIFDNAPPQNLDPLFNNIPENSVTERPSAELLAAGIAKAGREGRVAAWKGGNNNRSIEPEEQSDGSYLTCCPAHDDHNPSLVISDGVDKSGNPILLVTCRSACAQGALIAAINGLGLWNCDQTTLDELMLEVSANVPPTAFKTNTKKKCEAIVPVPANAGPAPMSHKLLGTITRRWPYNNPAGQTVFYVCRFDPNPVWQSNFQSLGKGKVDDPIGKTFRPLSYAKHDDGTERWTWVAPKAGVPLFRADKLAAFPDAPVVVCEGEKTALAAQKLFANAIAITWHGGAKAVSKAPWSEIANRDVTIWSDHDVAGASAEKAIVRELRQVGCKSISVVDGTSLAAVDPAAPDGARRQARQKWDAADAVSEWAADLARLKNEVAAFTQLLNARTPLEVSADNIGETANICEQILRDSHLRVFQRAGTIVEVSRCQEKTTDGRVFEILAAAPLGKAALGETLERVIAFQQYDARKRKLKPVHAPDLLLNTLIERGKRSSLAALTAVTDVPLIRRNGRVLDVPGYDEVSGIYYFPSGCSAHVSQSPSRDEAIGAVGLLRTLICDFPFSSVIDEAVALSAFLSAVNRPSLGPTPLHALSAPTPGSGKSLLARVITHVATGSEASFITQGGDDEELEKRISAQMMGGYQIINIDNCDRPLKGSALCNLLTADLVSLRILGHSEIREVRSSSFFLANGNNMRFGDDLGRRTVVSYIDPGMERPETRRFGRDVIAEARRNRHRYVEACLTIIRAYWAAGRPGGAVPLGSFELWSRSVRDALIWVGAGDPCGNFDKLRDTDPEAERFLELARQWDRHFQAVPKKIANVITYTNDTSHNCEELRLALMNVADAGRDINANRLGAYLARKADRPIGGFVFTSRRGRAGSKLWKLNHVP